LEELHKEQKVDEIDAAIEELNQSWAAASQEIYQAAAAEEQGNAGASAGESSAEGDDAVDADYEVVDEDEDEKK